MTANPNCIYKFGLFCLDSHRRALLRKGRPLALPPKALDLLTILVENSGRLITKEELLERVWPDTFVEEGNLTVNIFLLRKALGKGRKGQQYIETVPKRGYRFAARVRREDATELDSRERPSPTPVSRQGRTTEEERNSFEVVTVNQETEDKNEPSARPSLFRMLRLAVPIWAHFARIRARIWIGAGIILSVGVVLAIWGVCHSIRNASFRAKVKPVGIPALTKGIYVAVLPFQVLGDRSSLDHVAQGFAESLSTSLYRLKSVHLASAAATDTLKQEGRLEDIAAELGANLIVRGVVQGTPERMRICVDLEDVADDRRMWSGQFSGTEHDILKLEDQIYSGLAAALEPGSLGLLRGAGEHATENMEAYDLYLKGRDAMRSRQDLKEVAAAIRFQEGALKKDPDFALAYAGLADACLEMYRQTKEAFWSEKALVAAQQALRLNPGLSEIHFSLGSVYEEIGKPQEAVAALKRGLVLAPDSDEGYRRLGNAYLSLGTKQEALQAYQKAVEINPYYWFNWNVLGSAYVQLGRYDQALDAFRRITELEPSNIDGYENVGAVYLLMGKWNECIPFYREALRLQPSFVTYSNLGTAYFYLHRYKDALRMFEKATEMNPNDEVVAGNLADAYRWSGQREKGLQAYQRAIALAYKELEVNPQNATAMQSLALYYAKKGESDQALDFIRRARSIDPNSAQIIYNAAVVNTLAGHPDEALRVLREALKRGFSAVEAGADPELESLKARPEFQKLVKDDSGEKH
jgi:tetratricopeptide (TPR) repeat protein/DNA-binding winged helix-turn-helix (wHTH) protein